MMASQSTDDMNSPGAQAWWLAVRPKTLTAALVPVVVATALVKQDGSAVLWWISICALLSAMCIQIGTNFVNDAIDFHKGADTETRTGPRRMTQTGWLSSRQVMLGGFAFFLAAFAFGIPLAIHGGWPIITIGLVSLALGYGYTGGPFPLAYKGLGDLFVILFFGVIAVGGVFFLHAKELEPSVLIAGLQIGMLATVLIAINNLRDAPQDRLVGKKTLAVRFGVSFARGEILVLLLTPYVLGTFWSEIGVPMAFYLPLLTMPLTVLLLRGIFKNPPGPIYNAYLARAAGVHLLFGILLSLALWFG